MEKKKGSDHFRDILNPYAEKSNYGKIGRRRRLSKLNVLFFSIILSVTIILILIHFMQIPGSNPQFPISSRIKSNFLTDQIPIFPVFDGLNFHNLINFGDPKINPKSSFSTGKPMVWGTLW